MRTKLSTHDYTQIKNKLTGRTTQPIEEFINIFEKGPAELNKFRVDELKKILKYLNEKKEFGRLKLGGRKNELLERIACAIYPDYTPSRTILSPVTPPNEDQPLAKYVQALNPSLLISTVPPERGMSSEERTYHSRLQLNEGENDGHQDPYYKILDVLHVKVFRQTQRFRSTIVSFIFELSEERLNKIQNNREFQVQINLYDFNLKPMNWQAEVELYINEYLLETPRAPGKTKKFKQTLYTVRPVKISSNLLRTKNNIYMQVPKYIDFEGILGVLYIEEQSTEQIIEGVKKRTEEEKTGMNQYMKQVEVETIETKSSKQQLLDGLSRPRFYQIPGLTQNNNLDQNKENEEEDDDDVITETKEVLTLRDILSMKRIDIAVKGKNCVHKQCFDLKTFLQFCHHSSLWNCPVCEKPIKYSELRVDDFVNKILSEVSQDIEKVMVSGDSYEIVENKKIAQTPNIETEKIESDSESSSPILNSSKKVKEIEIIEID